MTSQNLKRAIGLFSDFRRTEMALGDLRNAGFPINKVSAVTKASKEEGSAPAVTRSEGASAGAITGSTVGGLLSLAGGLGVLLIPGFGPVLAAESLLGVLLGSGATAAVSGLYGGLQGWLVPDEQAKVYSDRVNQGEYLVTIEATEAEIQVAQSILDHWGIENWQVYLIP
jgi:hypothetical protein